MRMTLVRCFVVAMLVGSPAVHAACPEGACGDAAAMAQARARVAAACDCLTATSRKAYARCVKQEIRAAVKDGSLPRTCRKPLVRCETQSTCGAADAVVCCTLKNGGARSRMMKRGGRCRGTVCEGKGALAEACTAEATCAAAQLPPTSTTLPVVTTTLTTTTTVGSVTSTTLRVQAPFRSVQAVFQTSCALASCHSAFARQGGLVLESEEVSYDSLVDRPSSHAEARQVELLRVKSGDPEHSFLVRKLRGLGPGDAMPQGISRLPESIITMIEEWIRRGAHSTAEECPAATDDDALGAPQPQHAGEVRTVCDPPPPPEDYVWQPLPPLEAPAPATGIQLYVPPRPVDPGTEWETCYAFRPDWLQVRAAVGLTGNAPLTFKQQTYRMHEGSHHLLLYAYFGTQPEKWKLGQFFPCFAANPLNPDDGPPDAGTKIPIGGTQVAGTRYEVKYPQGVGIPLLPDPVNPTTVIIANLHYTNPFQPPQPIYGEAWLNLYFHAPGEFQALLDGIFAINFNDLFVEPFTSRTISRIWKPSGLLLRQGVDAAVFQLFGHMHKRGVEFRIDVVRDGKCSVSQALCGRDDDCACQPYQRNCTPNQTCVLGPAHEDSTIYYTTSWDHAPVVDFAKPYLRVGKDDGLRWTCTHTNGVEGDATRPPKRCQRGCRACGWDDATERCVLNPSAQLGSGAAIRYYNAGDPMPLVFGELADDDMCNMFGYFITQADADRLP